MEHLSTHERRQSPRFATDIALRSYKNGSETHCRALDLNADGALIRRRDGERPALVHEVELELSGGMVRAIARTIWSDGMLHAVKFVGLSDAERLDIAEQLDRAIH